MRYFCKQLDYFEDEFGFVSKEDFLLSLETGVPAKGVVLTFDDGLKCHYNCVFPELKRRGLWGIFYVPTGMYASDKIIDVHRIHILLGVVDSEMVYDQLMRIVTPEMLTDSARTAFREETYSVQQNDDHTLLVKRILNYFISYEHRETVIDELMRINNLGSIDDHRSFYINRGEIKQMHDSGMIIGSHTVNHPVMSKLSQKEQEAEISQSFGFLENIYGIPEVRTFCYPYGGFHSFTPKTESILSDYGCAFSFNVEPRDIETEDLLFRKQALPRYDCNQFKYGTVRI